MEDKYKLVDELMGRLTLEQKVGQLFTQAFYGTLLVPDVIRTITELNAGGLRITQFFRGFRRYARPGEQQGAFDRVSPDSMTPHLIDDRKDLLCKSPYLTIRQYAELLRELKKIAADRPYHIPLHMMLDQEGNASFDCIRGGIRTFASYFGIARRGDARLVHRICKAVGTQLSAVGFNMINSPVVDVVFDPSAAYIATRSFGCTVEHVCEMASAAVAGYRAGGLIACAKHFPGRGSTTVDDHHDVGEITKSDEQMWSEDLAPYRRVIGEGLGAIMVGHSIYPCWDAENLASVSQKILEGLVRGRLAFNGMVCTDSMIMGAIAKRYGVPRACMLAIKAGASQVLMKECGAIREEAYRLTMEAARSGEISEAHIDRLLIGNLKVKVDYSLFEDSYWHDPTKAERVVRSRAMERIEGRAAEEAVHLVRDRDGLLPLSATTRALLVEEVPRQYVNANDKYIHPGIFWEQMLAHGDNVSLLEVQENPTDEDLEKVATYAPFYERFIVTYYKDRNTLSTTRVVEALLEQGKKIIVVSSTPLPYEVPDHWPTVVCTYGIMPPVLKLAAALIYGKFTPKRGRPKAPWETPAKATA
ncbi:MAG TPA: glycoside hydrolase family 3 N-terminal domain-containing protein [Phycisphaerae bacterium]|nr:glycoside hydrolase family 3 N-terminal domain-containing protein [Phycisphaerae bacterium]